MIRCVECDGKGKVVICQTCDAIVVAGTKTPCCDDPKPGPVEVCEACEGVGKIDEDDLPYEEDEDEVDDYDEEDEDEDDDFDDEEDDEEDDDDSGEEEEEEEK